MTKWRRAAHARVRCRGRGAQARAAGLAGAEEQGPAWASLAEEELLCNLRVANPFNLLEFAPYACSSNQLAWLR